MYAVVFSDLYSQSKTDASKITARARACPIRSLLLTYRSFTASGANEVTQNYEFAETKRELKDACVTKSSSRANETQQSTAIWPHGRDFPACYGGFWEVRAELSGRYAVTVLSVGATIHHATVIG